MSLNIINNWVQTFVLFFELKGFLEICMLRSRNNKQSEGNGTKIRVFDKSKINKSRQYM